MIHEICTKIFINKNSAIKGAVLVPMSLFISMQQICGVAQQMEVLPHHWHLTEARSLSRFIHSGSLLSCLSVPM